MNNNAKIKNIIRTWHGSWTDGKQRSEELLVFHLTDVATVVFTTTFKDDKLVTQFETCELPVDMFEERFNISMFELLNS